VTGPLAPPPSPWRRRSLAAAAGALLLYLFSLTVADPDLWGHVRFGQDLFATGRVVRPDPYSYLTGDQAWINHEWLAEAVFAAAYDALGAPGLIALKTAAALAILGLIARHLGGWGGAHALVLVATAGLLLPWFAAMRPQLFTYLGVLLVLLAICRAEQGRTRALWWMPALFAVWANLHGGVLAGAALLLVWAASHAVGWAARVDRSAAQWRRAGASALLSLLALLATPYGVGLPAFLLATATVPRPDIAEWSPIDVGSPYGAVYVIVLAVAGVSLYGSGRAKPIPLMAILAGAAVSPLLAVRHAPLFAIAFAVLAGPYVVDCWAAARPAVRVRVPPALARALALACPIAAAALIALAVPHFRCIRIRPVDFPVAVIARLADSGVRGALVVHFDWGQYAIWHLGPRIQVSHDGRRETVYSRRARELNDRFTWGVGRWDELLGIEPVDLVLVSTRFPIANLMKRLPGWRLVQQDAGGALFARDGTAAMEQVSRTPIRVRLGGGCWPGGQPGDAVARAGRAARAARPLRCNRAERADQRDRVDADAVGNHAQEEDADRGEDARDHQPLGRGLTARAEPARSRPPVAGSARRFTGTGGCAQAPTSGCCR
jgi:hypothetical protein